MSLFSRRESQLQVTNKRKRRPAGVSRRRKKELGVELLEDRRVMSATSLVNYDTTSYSSATPEGQLAILQQELYRAMQQSSQGSNYEMSEMSIPTDPLLNKQWHLINTGQQVGGPDFQNIFGIPGEDINVGGAWNLGYTGEGVKVGVFELSTLQTTHPDLQANMDPNLSFLFGPTGGDHATAVAGLIGAVANNGIGGSGVAPGTTLVPMSGVNTPGAITNAIRYALDNNIDVVNNSWGPSVVRGLTSLDPDQMLALRDSVFFGRDGLGTIWVFAAGNAGKEEDSASYNGFVNSRYTIGVTGVDHDGEYNNIDGTVTGYPMTGASVLVAAPTGSNTLRIVDDFTIGSGIITTDLTGEAGYNQTGFVTDRDFLPDINYTSTFNGTSAAAPQVTGVIALMLEANPNLSWRDVQEILLRSARQNAEFATQANGADLSLGIEYQSTWIQNQVPLFHEPDAYDPTIDPGLLLVYPTLDPSLTLQTGESHYAPTPQTMTNGAGYTVSQGRGTDNEQIGFAHGVVDAELAVKLAAQWTTKNQHLPAELTFTTAVNTPGANNLPAAEVVEDVFGENTADLVVPGGLGGGGGFADFWREYLADEPDFQTYPSRGLPRELSVPANNTMVVENIEISIEVAGSMTDFLNNVRVVLVSPSGTHSELNHYFVSPSLDDNDNFHQAQGITGNGLNGVSEDNTWHNPVSTDTGVQTFTFSTNRIWGERSDDMLIIDPTTGEPIAGSGNLYNVATPISTSYLTSGWQLYFENYSDADFSIPSLEVAWHGSPIGANTKRIQGLVGVDDNQDNAFNYSRVNMTTGDLYGDPNTVRLGEVVNTIDLTHESMAANVTVVARRASDGVIVDRFVTGADGNFYFDLVPDDYIISIEDPEGRVALEDTLSPPNVLQNYKTQWTVSEEFFRVWDYDQNLRVAVDGNGVPLALDGNTELSHVSNINFLLDPGPPAAQQVEFHGTIVADFNGDGILNGNDVAVPNITVYADVNRNGQRDPGEVAVQSDANGQYTLIAPVTATTVINVGVVAPANWTYSDPVSGFEPLYVEPGDVFTGIDLRLTPPLGTSGGDGTSLPGYLMGVVYEDANNNGTRQSTESGVSGIQVYIDQNNNGTHEVNEPLATTNANGAYIFGNVAPGTHRVRAIPVAPLVSINPGVGVPRVVTLAGGGTVSQIEFGIGLGSNPTSVYDYGDLPSQYHLTLNSDNGARHPKGAYFLGTKIDVENDGQPSINADGDDLVGPGNDEDGIVVTPLIPGTTGTLVATASRQGGVLQGWVDFNGDFDFNDPGERIITNVALNAGANTVTFQIPATLAGAGSATGGVIYARFRYGEYGINSLTGTAKLGEVEDYILAKDPSALPAVVIHGPDFNEDGNVDGRDFLILQRNWGRTNALGTQGDANGDGVVGYNDQVMWKNYYGTAVGGYAAFTAGDDDESPAAIVAVEQPLEDQVAAVLGDVVDQPEEAPLVEAILIVDTVGSSSVVEVSAQASTSVVPKQVDTASVAAAFKLLSGESDTAVEEESVVLDADDLDVIFGSSSDLTDLALAMKKDESDAYRYEDTDLPSGSDDDNAFALAFADEADWLQF
jgi:hypothetical protein